MNKYGQSTIEYAIIVILVILGIVIMGPYVLRSIDAHFKLWDYSVKDSFSEHLTQAPANDIPFIPSSCNCTDIPEGCGGTGNPQCLDNEKTYNHNCTPILCDGAPSSYCAYDPSCCTIYYPQSCGTVPIPVGGLPTGTSCSTLGGTNGVPPGEGIPPTATCSSPIPGSDNPCYYGQKAWATQCSTLPVQCVSDATCNPTCLGQAPSNTVACPGSPGTPGGPAINMDYSIIFTPTCPSTPGACEYQCNLVDGYVFINGQCACEPGKVEYEGKCVPCTFSLSHTSPNHGCAGTACCPGGNLCEGYGYSNDAPQMAAYLCKNNGYNYMYGYTTGGTGCNDCRRVDISNYSPSDADLHGDLSSISFYFSSEFTHCNSCGDVNTVTCSYVPLGTGTCGG